MVRERCGNTPDCRKPFRCPDCSPGNFCRHGSFIREGRKCPKCVYFEKNGTEKLTQKQEREMKRKSKEIIKAQKAVKILKNTCSSSPAQTHEIKPACERYQNLRITLKVFFCVA